jgi:hypothetical protein
VVLVIVLISKFASGAWIVVVAMPVIWLTMRGIRGHYDSVAAELVPPAEAPVTLPASNRAIVLVSKLHLPTMRALAYARATRPSHLEAITVNVDEAETARLQEEWDRSDIPVPLTVVDSPYRDITRPVVQYVKQMRRESPRDIVTVFIPEYVLGHWWEQVLHNQSALRLKARLLQQRGVVVASVPYQLRSATQAAASPGLPWKAALSPLRRLTAEREALQAEELRAEMEVRSAKPIGDCGDREVADIAGVLRSVTHRPRGPSLTMEADLWDGTGNITLVWLGRRNIPGIYPGRRIVVHGRVARIKGERTLFNPIYELQPAAAGGGTEAESPS